MLVLFIFVVLCLAFINVFLELPLDLLSWLRPSSWLVGAIALIVLAWCLDDR